MHFLLDGNVFLTGGTSFSSIYTFPEWITMKPQQQNPKIWEAYIIHLTKNDSEDEDCLLPCSLSVFRDNGVVYTTKLGGIPTAIEYIGGSSNLTLLAIGSSVMKISCENAATSESPRKSLGNGNFKFGASMIWKLPTVSYAEEEIDLWKQAQNNTVTLDELVSQFVNLKSSGMVNLSNQAITLINMISESDKDVEALAEARFDYVSWHIQKQLEDPDGWAHSEDTIIALKVMPFSPVSEKVLVIATEMLNVFLVHVKSNGSLNTLHQFYVSEKISLIDCHGIYETGNYRIIVVTRDSVIYQISEGTCFRVTKCESVPIAVSIIDQNHFCIASLNNEIIWIDFEGSRLSVHRETCAITCLESISLEDCPKFLAVALESGHVKLVIQRGKVLSKFNTAPKIVSCIKYGSYDRQASSLILNTNDGDLMVKFFKDNFADLYLQAYNDITSFPPIPGTMDNLDFLKKKFKKGKTFADLVRRHQNEAQVMHETWELDEKPRLKYLTLKTLKDIEAKNQKPNDAAKIQPQMIDIRVSSVFMDEDYGQIVVDISNNGKSESFETATIIFRYDSWMIKSMSSADCITCSNIAPFSQRRYRWNFKKLENANHPTIITVYYYLANPEMKLDFFPIKI